MKRHMVSTSSMQVFKYRAPSSYSSMGKVSLKGRCTQYIKDRTKEGFDDYFPCMKKNCKLKHVKQWLNLFAYYYNNEILS